ncbi:MAG: glycosyltransferase [Candidatus Aminicenantes bacterium]|nr:glycosyltransferase [Candidatus Aminicenantes bacterium]
MTCQIQDSNTISVIIPVYKAATSLEKTLLSIAAQQPCGRAVTILVANDGADAAVTAVCRRRGVSMVAITPRRGSYFARNRALEKTRGELVVFWDAGIQLAKNWLCEALSTLKTADYLAGEVDISTAPRPTAAEAYEKLCSYPIAEKIAAEIFSLPMHPYLEAAEQERITAIINTRP